ncbi:MAG: SusC/RagA family TonB-linked outer membrane protein [Odoribacter splanchnicus]
MKKTGRIQILKHMRNLFLFILLSASSVWAKGSYSQETQLKLNVKNGTLESIFNQITRQSQLEFFYNTNALDVKQKVDLSKKTGTLDEILKEILGDKYRYRIKDQYILISEVEPEMQAEKKSVTINGQVRDRKGAVIPGVTVLLKGTTLGTATDMNGEFKITVPEQPEIILQFSFIGMKNKNVEYKGELALKIVLEEDVAEMEEVIVTGIFTRKAESYTGAAVTVTQDQLKRVGNQNIFQSLRNIDPSLAISDNLDFGSDPNKLPDMKLRGTSSFPGADDGLDLKGNYMNKPNQPLFILDGFEASVEKIFDMDMNRVESVTILKDASAKALYGSKAANGVVVIETKRLLSGQLRVTYNGSLDIEAPDLTSYDLCNSLEKLEVEKVAGYYITERSPEQRDYLEKLYATRKKAALEGLDTDWLSKPLRTGIGHKHSLSFEMGDENLRVIADVSYNQIAGVMKGSGRTNLAGSMNVSYRLKNFLFKNIMSITSNKSTDSPYGTFRDYASMNPYWRATDSNGNIPRYAEIIDLGYDRYKYITNPLYNSTLNTKLDASYLEFTNNFYAEWTILEGLKATARIGITTKKNEADSYYPANHTKFEDYSKEDFFRKGSYQLNNGKSSDLSGDFNINYSKSIDKHYLFLNGGLSLSEKTFDEVIHYAEGFPSDKMDHIMFARQYAKDSRPTGLENTTRDMGILGVFSYSYDNRYLTDITLRSNGSSQFGKNNRWALFWSAGLGWNIHNEKFLRESKIIKQLKLRGSVGYTGNQNFSGYQAISTYKYYLDKSYQDFIGSYLLGLANDDLKWEQKLDYNVGLDALIQRLTLRFNYYVAYTDNLLTDISLPTSTGFSTMKENLGKVKNDGFELDASYTAFQNRNGYVNFTFSIATNKNKIMKISDALKKYNDEQDKIAASRNQGAPVKKYAEGMSMNAIWAVPSMGIDPATGREIYINRKGQMTYNWNVNDMIVCGDSESKYRGNFGVNGEYKGIGLSVVFRYLGGGKMYNQTLVDRVENIDVYYNVDRRVLSGRWQEPGQHADYKILGDYWDSENEVWVNEKTRATSRFVQKRNELDFASLTAYYDFKREWIQKIGLERLKLSFYMNDICKFSSIKVERGLDYPFARTMSFALSATF